MFSIISPGYIFASFIISQTSIWLFSCTLGFKSYNFFNCKNTLLEIKFQAAWAQLSPEFYSNILLYMPTDSNVCIYNLLINHTHRRHTTFRDVKKKILRFTTERENIQIGSSAFLRGKAGRFTQTHVESNR